MRRVVVLLITTAVVMILVALLLMGSLFAVERIAFVSEVRGDVRLKAPGAREFVPLSADTHVAVGSVLRTGKDGEAQIGWVDGTRISVSPESELSILKCRLNKRTGHSVTLLKLDAGKIWTRIIQALQGQSKFEVHTPTATAGVRGTTFSVEVQRGGATVVSVWEGTVAVGSGRQAISVEAGHTATVQDDGRKAQALDQAERAAWEQSGMTGPLLHIDSLQAEGDVVRLQGRTDPGTTLTVNGTAVPVGQEGRFSDELGVSAAGKLEFVATDAKGETKVTRDVGSATMSP